MLEKPEMQSIVNNEKSSNDGFLSSFMDGKFYKTNDVFTKYPNILRIQLYYDDLEVTNPLGSKTSIHKLGAFYFTLQNIQSHHLCSSPKNIHLLMLCHSEDINKYGFKKILNPFLADMKKLESEEGVTVNIAGQEVVLRATICAFCSDGLAAHQNDLLQPSCKMFCRMCLITRDNLHAGNFEEHTIRTKELFDQHVLASKVDAKNLSATGIREECVLKESLYFHSATNYVFDAMHDFLESICPMEIKYVLNQFVYVDKYFKVSMLNARLATFN